MSVASDFFLDRGVIRPPVRVIRNSNSRRSACKCADGGRKPTHVTFRSRWFRHACFAYSRPEHFARLLIINPARTRIDVKNSLSTTYPLLAKCRICKYMYVCLCYRNPTTLLRRGVASRFITVNVTFFGAECINAVLEHNKIFIHYFAFKMDCQYHKK